jgi:hypothetical protein
MVSTPEASAMPITVESAFSRRRPSWRRIIRVG